MTCGTLLVCIKGSLSEQLTQLPCHFVLLNIHMNCVGMGRCLITAVFYENSFIVILIPTIFLAFFCFLLFKKRGVFKG